MRFMRSGGGASMRVTHSLGETVVRAGVATALASTESYLCVDCRLKERLNTLYGKASECLCSCPSDRLSSEFDRLTRAILLTRATLMAGSRTLGRWVCHRRGVSMGKSGKTPVAILAYLAGLGWTFAALAGMDDPCPRSWDQLQSFRCSDCLKRVWTGET